MAYQQPPAGSIPMAAQDMLAYEPGEPCVFLVKFDALPWTAHLLVRPTDPPHDYFPAEPGYVNAVRFNDSTNQRVGNTTPVHVIPASWLNLKLFV